MLQFDFRLLLYQWVLFIAFFKKLQTSNKYCSNYFFRYWSFLTNVFSFFVVKIPKCVILSLVVKLFFFWPLIFASSNIFFFLPKYELASNMAIYSSNFLINVFLLNCYHLIRKRYVEQELFLLIRLCIFFQ